MVVRFVLFLIAVLMAYKSWQALRLEHTAVHSLRLGFWLTMLAWLITQVQILGLLAVSLLGLSVLTWIAPRFLPRRAPRRPRIERPDDGVVVDADGELRQLRESLESLPEAKRIAQLPETDVYAYLRRDETMLRLAAAERLRTVATPENAERLVEYLHGERRETDEGVRLKLALVLARWQRRESLPVLSAALQPDRPGRWEALAALVELGASQYVPEVLSLAERETDAVGTANAVHAALRLGVGDELLARRWRRVVHRYVEGIGQLLPSGEEEARGVVSLLRGSTDQDHRDLADELEQLLTEG